MYYVYILLCKDNTLYTGITDNVERRFSEHKKKRGGYYTSSHGAVKIVYKEEYSTRKEAFKREKEIKSWWRGKKLKLIKFGKPNY